MRSVSGRVRPLACVALLAFAVGVAVQATGALDGLERETLKARYDVRGAEPTDDVVVVAVDAKSFDVLREQWPFPRSLHARAVRRLHAAGAREIVYDVQFTEPTTPREDLALYNAIGDAGGAVLATSESDGHGHTDVLGGDANLRRVNARAAASDLSNDDAGAVTRFERSVGGLETLPVVAAKRAGAPPLPGERLRRRRCLDRLPRPARQHPHRLVLRRGPRPRRPEPVPRPHRRGRRVGAHPA